MRRWLFNIAAAVSGVMMVGCVVLWVHSYDMADRLHGQISSQQAFILASKQGRLTIIGFAPRSWLKEWRVLSYPYHDWLSIPGGNMSQYKNVWGFGTIDVPNYFVMRPVETRPDGTTVDLSGAATANLGGSGVIVPDWFITSIFAILPALWLYRRIRHRTKPGHCSGCGYNLKGTIEAGRGECPECGKAIEAKA